MLSDRSSFTTGSVPQTSLSEMCMEYVSVESESSQMTPQESLVKSSKLGRKGRLVVRASDLATGGYEFKSLAGQALYS